MNDENAAIRAALGSLRMFVFGADTPRPRPRTWFGRLVPLLAVGAAFLLGLASFAFLQANARLPAPVTVLVSAVSVVSLALAPSRPLLAWRVAWVVAAATGILVNLRENTPWPWHPVQVVLLVVALFVVGLRYGRGVLVWAWVSAVVLIVVFANNNNIPGVLFGATLIVAVADQIRRRREAQSRLVAEQERSELEQARRAILEERTRIARELHDVVAHHMSLIAVRAETAPYRLDGVPPQVAEEFTAIAETSREALTEMRRLLGVLRSPTPPDVQPQPGLADLADLVVAVREAGVDAWLDVDPALRVPAGVGLTAYRIVQEALSNARRHASGAPVQITVRPENEMLAVYVVNGPGVPSETGEDAGSHGLVGMQERATMLGGSLAAGPTGEGGFLVHATLPVSGDA